MSRTNEVRKILYSILRELCENVYYEEADKENLYPHIVYEYTGCNTEDYQDTIYFDIDIYDKNVFEIETLCDDVQDALDREYQCAENILASFYLEDRKAIKDENKEIKHRLIRISCQMAERG